VVRRKRCPNGKGVRFIFLSSAGTDWLWEAVLFEHARCGYEDMPAKGGCTTLDDVAVTKAAEYMMALTYPEMPRG